jgi:hypothetical protein
MQEKIDPESTRDPGPMFVDGRSIYWTVSVPVMLGCTSHQKV